MREYIDVLSRNCKIYFSFQIISEQISEIQFDQLKPTVNSHSEKCENAIHCTGKGEVQAKTQFGN